MNFNHDLYRKIRNVRKSQGLQIANLNKQVTDYPLLNKRVHDKSTQKDYTVTDVRLHWYTGWYYVLIITDDHKSTGVRFWQNLSCHDPIILNSIKESNEDIIIL